MVVNKPVELLEHLSRNLERQSAAKLKWKHFWRFNDYRKHTERWKRVEYNQVIGSGRAWKQV